MIPKTLGGIIKERRLIKGLKVFELANKVGVNPVYISQIEKHNKLPSQKVLESIEKALDIKLFDFYIKQKSPDLERRFRHSVSGGAYILPPPSLPPVVIKEFPSPNTQRLIETIRRNLETNSPPSLRKGYADFLRIMTPGEKPDNNLYDQILDIVKVMKKENEAYWQKFIQQSKLIESIITNPKSNPPVATQDLFGKATKQKPTGHKESQT